MMPKRASLAAYVLSGGAAEHRTFGAGLDALDAPAVLALASSGEVV